ncbi:MAG TPA: acetyl-CoA decarbonylase/synthase complex subunit delta [Bacillota bacterium]|nr:acetyl-CoA decarbonylase/synthase complex subunit delta [Bacillota bacterium]
MTVALARERWAGQVAEMTIGKGSGAVSIGGEKTLPFLHFEGEMPNKPAAALELWDVEPVEWPEVLKRHFHGVLGDAVAWAKRCAGYGADLICLRLASAHPDYKDASPGEAAATAASVAEATELPLIVVGCGVEEKDALILPAVSRALAGRNALIGCATANNYKTVCEACLADGHGVIASTPLDINLAKQLNIMMNETGLPPNRIVIDPLVGSLGYGLEYAYSIIERTRLSALSGDRMLAMPVVCFVGYETWKTRESRAEDSEEWGPQEKRAVLWEAVTAASLAQAGGSLFVMYHPESLVQFKKHIDCLMETDQF